MSKKILIKAMAKGVHKGRLNIQFADGSEETFGTPTRGFPNVSLRFVDKRVPRDLILDPDLGLGETFMDERLIIEEGDILDFATLLRANNPFDKAKSENEQSPLARFIKKTRFNFQQINNQIRSQQNVAHHYDIGNDLYQLMLDDEHMQYSCGYWPKDDMTLAEAQEAKLVHIASKLALAEDQTVLDIGCGWGGMAIFLAKQFKAKVHAITLSQEQLELAESRARNAGVSDRINFELVDYRELAERGNQFDRIVSVGMFEHVGRPQFEQFFTTAKKLLKEDGVMLLHTIGRIGPPGITDAFTSKYIFPGGYIPALSETMAASERTGMMATDVEILRIHYAKTIKQWYRNCLQHRDTIIQMFDERFYRMWTLYLAGAATVFEYGSMCNFQIQYVRDRHSLPLTRDYLHDAEDAINRSRNVDSTST